MIDRMDALNAVADTVLTFRPSPSEKETPGKKNKNAGFDFYEFFAGGGMARAGLGKRWNCLFANDFDYKKSTVYEDNWGIGTIKTKDVGQIKLNELPGKASLIWASFPCQDLSLAGMGAGLKGDRSGTFWPFWNLVKKLKDDNRAPCLVVLENVCGTITSHDGADFSAIANALTSANYKFGAVVIDAAEFVPHSRPRLFIIAVAEGYTIPSELLGATASSHRHTRSLRDAYKKLSEDAKKNWIWWNMPRVKTRTTRFSAMVEENPDTVNWHTVEETEKLLAMMDPVNLKKVAVAKAYGKLRVGTIYKRTRIDKNGAKVQRAEVRFDHVAGCLRTPAGGSSRQLILVVRGKKVRSRLLSSREAARLMGLPETYKLPHNYNEAYHLLGDGVVVPVVRYISEKILEPISSMATTKTH